MVQQDILAATREMQPRERAAALAHWIYVTTAEREDWAKRVPDDWEALSAAERNFNFANIETWAGHPDVLAAWLEAVRSVQGA